jgi:DNA-binding LacI/PurR family transcriptional regulator
VFLLSSSLIVAETERKRYRMIDIAERANVSRTAVTHVLTGAGAGRIGGVSAAKAAEIRQIAAELGYVPNQAAQQLAGKRSGIIGALARTWNMATERRLHGWLQQIANARGFDVLGAQSNDELKSVERFLDNCQSRGVDGLLVMAFASDDLWSQAAPLLSRFPRVIALVGNPQIEAIPCVASDVADGTFLGVRHLHEKGRLRIVQILENLNTAMNRCRQQAFFEAHRQLGRPVDADQICLATEGWTENDFAKMYPVCGDLLARGTDAILADTDFTASMLIRALHQHGRRVPDDVAVIGWGNEDMAPWCNPQITTTSYQFNEVATAAVDMLGEWIETPERAGIRSRTVPMRLIVRESA